ncbi:hypothetical protein GCM10023080_036640 [Streptomyces pseudoechinosporeus]
MPGLRRADAPAHGPDPPTHPRGAGNGATSHHAPAPDNEPNRRRHPAGNGATSHDGPAVANEPNPPPP